MKFIIVKERESQKWFPVGLIGHFQIGGTKRNPKYAERRSVYPKPEDVSAFIESHKIIEAKNKEDAKCQVQNLNSRSERDK